MRTRERVVRRWNGQDDVTLFVDSDGDIGIADENYSIVLSSKGSSDLRDWLNEVLGDKPKAPSSAGPPPSTEPTALSMSLRDWYAGQAMQEAMRSYSWQTGCADMVEKIFDLAAAMAAEAEKRR